MASTTAPAGVALVIEIGTGGFAEILTDWLTEPTALVAVIVNVMLLWAGGVPDKTPPLVSVNQPGSTPGSDQTIGCPPTAVKVWL